MLVQGIKIMKKLHASSLIISAILALTSCQNSTNTSSYQNDPTNNSVNISSNTNLATKISVTSDSNVVNTVTDDKYWSKIELIRTTDPKVADEKMLPKGRQRDAEIVKCFGTDTPSSKDFCLHDAGAPDKLKYPTPILLVHGANTNATRSWADPDGDGSKTGLMQYLKGQGYHVFAITYANKHGDNYIWASHIHRAISRIKQITNVDKVDTLGHSKGGFALRLYVSNVNDGTFSYANDVRKAIFVASPHRGIDLSFRHPSLQWFLYPDKDNPLTYAPMVWTKILWQGTFQDSKDLSFSGEYFPGQSQLVARFDKIHPLSPVEPDWYTSYNGGQGLVSYSPGIDAVIKQGGNLVDKIIKSPVVSTVKVAVLAGNNPNVPGIANELTGASDGIVFVASAKATSDLTAGGATLLAEKLMPLNHLSLVSDPTSMKWISDQLAK